jgi:8-oxo-dGTP diphosphatase
MRNWTVAGGLLEGPDGLLLVRNRRRNGSLDWSPPGGVVDDGEALLEGLTREVAEETGLRVLGWQGPVYEIDAVAEGLGWRLRVEAYVATAYEGVLCPDDPDGIVVDARFVPFDACSVQLEGAWLSVHEPLGAWLAERWSEARSYRYRVEGDRRSPLSFTRL